MSDELQAERDLEDAKRYRWLRSKANIVDEDGGWASHYTLPNIPRHNDSPSKKLRLENIGFDRSIDRARIVKHEPGAASGHCVCGRVWPCILAYGSERVAK